MAKFFCPVSGAIVHDVHPKERCPECSGVHNALPENNFLQVYMLLEADMMELDDRNDPKADGIRDVFLDPIWRVYLSEDERNFLNSRKFED
jgi:hypothetical protein